MSIYIFSLYLSRLTVLVAQEVLEYGERSLDGAEGKDLRLDARDILLDGVCRHTKVLVVHKVQRVAGLADSLRIV